MRPTLIVMAALAVLVQACVPGLPNGSAAGGGSATGGEAVATTTLADPLAPAMVDAAEPLVPPAAAAPATRPKPRPGEVTEVAPVAAEIVPEPKSQAQLKCEKSGGRWSVVVGTLGRSCVRPTRDGGKSCERESQCDGQCLARSRTCAPFDPLWGCNEVLQDDGSRVTFCLN